MEKQNEAVTLTPEEADGLNGLRARVAEIDKLGDIHPWLNQKIGKLSALQITGRINSAAGNLVEMAITSDENPMRVQVAHIAIWLVHLAAALEIDLLTAMNLQVDLEKRMEVMAANGVPSADTAAKA